MMMKEEIKRLSIKVEEQSKDIENLKIHIKELEAINAIKKEEELILTDNSLTKLFPGIFPKEVIL